MARKAFLIDTTRCTACRACQVACKQWNKLPAEETEQRGSYENPPNLTPHLYNQIHFIEKDTNGAVRWLFLNRRCLHCGDAGCMKVCPSAGALYRTEEGMVAFNQEKCISCKYCVNGCPFDVPRYDEKEKVTKCHACFDRIANGLQPACVKACPTGTLQFGDRNQFLAKTKAQGKSLYGENELNGLGVLYVLDDTPGTYQLPDKPVIPASIFFWKDVLRPLGIFGFWGAIGVTLLHYVTVGPKRLEDESQEKGGE